MKLLKNIKNFLYKADFFYSTQLLRYKDQPEYRTLFGGVLSLLIIMTLIGTFYNKFVDTLNKVVITSVFNNQNAADPTPYLISTSTEDDFMFGVEIWHLDLNTGPRYFDVVLTSAQFKTGQRKEQSVEYELQPCELYHWEGFPQVQKEFTRLKMNQWLCLPKNKTYNIQGKYASEFSQTLQVAVKKCTNSSKDSRPCAPQKQIDQYFQKSGPQFFTIYFINPLINPSSKEYLTHYLQDNNYIIFTDKFGSEGILFMEEYEITTDESILPYNQLRDEKGGIVNQFALKNPYEVTQTFNVYCSFSFFKSGIKKSYQRKFQKLDEILSYIGGLFGTIAVVLFIVNAYNSNSFEVTLGASLFHNKNEKEENELKKYNFFSFLAHLLYIVSGSLGCSPNWKKIKKYDECRLEMKKQLDISYLLERVFFLERTINNLLEEHQLKGLYLQQKLTLEQAKKIRQKFKIKRKVMKLSKEQRAKQITEKDPIIKITEQTLEMIDPVINQMKKSEEMMEVKSHSSDGKMNNINMGKDVRIFPNNLQLFETESEEITGSSCSSDDEIEIDLTEDINRLKKQSEKGNVLSQRIWQRIKPSLKKKINRISSIQSKSEKSISFPMQPELAQKPVQKYLESHLSNQVSLDVRTHVLATKPSKIKISNSQQYLVQGSHISSNWRNQMGLFDNVLIENQLKTSPTDFS